MAVHLLWFVGVIFVVMICGGVAVVAYLVTRSQSPVPREFSSDA